jgi:hypothetical protein
MARQSIKLDLVFDDEVLRSFVLESLDCPESVGYALNAMTQLKVKNGPGMARLVRDGLLDKMQTLLVQFRDMPLQAFVPSVYNVLRAMASSTNELRTELVSHIIIQTA